MIVIDSETGKYEKIEVMGKLGYKIETVSVIDEWPGAIFVSCWYLTLTIMQKVQSRILFPKVESGM